MAFPIGGLGPGNGLHSSTFLFLRCTWSYWREEHSIMSLEEGKGEKINAGGWLSKPQPTLPLSV